MNGGTFYCVVPRDLGSEAYELLRAHWRDDPSITVMRDRRVGERRKGDEAGGRRVRERRGTGVAEAPVKLPRRLCAYARRLRFGIRHEVNGRDPEDVDCDRLIVHIQHGDAAAFEKLYVRYFDRVYAYARVALRDDHEAEDVAQQVFGNVIQALPRYEIRDDSSFRAWLFRITRNVVLRTLARNGRMQPQEPAELDRRLESPIPEPPFKLEWLGDKDLSMLVERLPVTQQQVILLRYVFEFRTNEIAEVLERTPVAIRMLEHRAMRALEARLQSLRGITRRCDRSPMVALARPAPVLLRRSLALQGYGGAPLL